MLVLPFAARVGTLGFEEGAKLEPRTHMLSLQRESCDAG
jgi:hypothetical protein